jgi:hypothetical protein
MHQLLSVFGFVENYPAFFEDCEKRKRVIFLVLQRFRATAALQSVAVETA